MAEVIPGKTKNAPKKRNKSSWKMRLEKQSIFKMQKSFKKSFSRKISGFHKSEKKQKQAKEKLQILEKRFFLHLEIVENIFCIL